jgi:hypothetical protein
LLLEVQQSCQSSIPKRKYYKDVWNTSKLMSKDLLLGKESKQKHQEDILELIFLMAVSHDL